MSRGPGPTFLVGAERSGTTLLRLMLDHHPRIAFLYEFDYAVTWLGDDGARPDLAAYHRALAQDRIFLSTKASVDPALPYDELVEGFLRRRLEGDRKELVGATVHHHFDRLLHLWPDARFVHLLRDPRDVARSCVAMGWAGNPWCGVERWIVAERTWEHLASRLEPSRIHELRYEDLVREPEATLRELCRALGVEYDPAMLRYPERSTYPPPDPASAEAWRRTMAPLDVRLVEARVGPLLVARGYAPSGLPPLEVRAARRARLLLQDAVARRRARVARYGPRLVAADFLSRRLRLAGWQARVRRELHRVDEAHLR
jgi:hypothetical protein